MDVTRLCSWGALVYDNNRAMLPTPPSCPHFELCHCILDGHTRVFPVHVVQVDVVDPKSLQGRFTGFPAASENGWDTAGPSGNATACRMV